MLNDLENTCIYVV